jgi:predicted DNA-binding transcriptional regulator AlpA
MSVLIIAKDVAKRYGIHVKTLARWVHDERTGFPQPVTIGNRWYFPAASLEAWDARNERISSGNKLNHVASRVDDAHERPRP